MWLLHLKVLYSWWFCGQPMCSAKLVTLVSSFEVPCDGHGDLMRLLFPHVWLPHDWLLDQTAWLQRHHLHQRKVPLNPSKRRSHYLSDLSSWKQHSSARLNLSMEKLKVARRNMLSFWDAWQASHHDTFWLVTIYLLEFCGKKEEIW